MVFPHPCLPALLLLLNAKENNCGDHCRGWGYEELMYCNHNVEKKNISYNTSQSNEPLIENRVIFMRGVVHGKLDSNSKRCIDLRNKLNQIKLGCIRL